MYVIKKIAEVKVVKNKVSVENNMDIIKIIKDRVHKLPTKENCEPSLYFIFQTFNVLKKHPP